MPESSKSHYYDLSPSLLFGSDLSIRRLHPGVVTLVSFVCKILDRFSCGMRNTSFMDAVLTCALVPTRRGPGSRRLSVRVQEDEVYDLQFGQAFAEQATDPNARSVLRDDFALEIADMDE